MPPIWFLLIHMGTKFKDAFWLVCNLFMHSCRQTLKITKKKQQKNL